MRSFLFSLVAAAAVTCSAAAHADTINFASAPRSTTYTYVDGEGSLNGTGGTASAYQNSAWAAPIAGSAWVSTSPDGGDYSYSTTNYTNEITLLADELYSGSISVMADDQAAVLINGIQVYAMNASVNFFSPTSIQLLSSYFKAGVNTITVQDLNSGGGPAGADFAGTLTGVAATPEPSSLMLLGTGALGMAGMVRRRFQTA